MMRAMKMEMEIERIEAPLSENFLGFFYFVNFGGNGGLVKKGE